MRKGIKILGKVFSAAVLLLIIVPVALSLLLDIPAVQNYAVHRAARFVSRKLETTVSIDRVDIGIFSKVRVKGFYVEDYQRDTLLYVGKLDAFITSFGIFGGGLELSRGEIADARLYLRQTPGGEMNIKQIVDRISDPDKPKKGNFRLSLKKASIENMDLCLERLDHRDPEHGIDFSHMHLYGITARVDDFTIDGQAIYTSIAAFSARERSGFVLNHLAGRFYMTQGCLGFENASIITPRSNVNFPFVSLAGDSWAQYKDFIGEVRIDASMRGDDARGRRLGEGASRHPEDPFRPVGSPPALHGPGRGRAGPRHRGPQTLGQAGRRAGQFRADRPQCPFPGTALVVRHAAGRRDGRG